MWEFLPIEDRQEYQRLILAFASLTEMFTQKADDDVVPSPIINSKFQETVFQKSFHAVGEDIGNTSYDVSLRLDNGDGTETKYLVGIKTFGFASGDQKIAQFKTNHGEWSHLIDKIENNALDNENNYKSKDEINNLNYDLYLELAKKIADIRNKRIESSRENLRGFDINKHDNVISVYHVLMPSKKGDSPKIYVGETPYNKINIDNISIHGCTSPKNPSNFTFDDGEHLYKYTSADSQLLMKFNNSKIVKDEWDVKYAENAYNIFHDISIKIYGDIVHEEMIESYSWSLLNSKGEVELFSGLNSFYAVGSKIAKDKREFYINKLVEKYKDEKLLNVKLLEDMLHTFLIKPASAQKLKMKKVELREKIKQIVIETKNEQLIEDVNKLVYRPKNEVYIPIPNSKKFHHEHPDFFGEKIGLFKKNDETGKDTSELLLTPKEREFNLIFEPSGDSVTAYIAQDNGKAIESAEKQSYLGEWILRKIFQLDKYEILTKSKLEEIGINGIRLYKKNNSNDIHLEFIWIDSNELPKDYIG